MTAPHDPDAGQGSPGRRRPRPGRRWWLRAAVAALVLLGVTGADAAVLAARVGEVPVGLAADDADGRTWVLVGLDSRAALPEGADPADFGTPDAVPGSRADVVVVVHQTDAGTTVLSVPRDVLVDTGSGPGRLALSWLDGPGTTVDALCGLGIPADHLVTVDLAGFAAVVDAVGGVDVDVPEPVRDPLAGLDLPTAGRRHLDGATALALVRSRHPEHPAGGRWIAAAPDPDGRAAAAGTVLQALAGAARAERAHPWRLQELAWAASGALAVDDGTTPTALARLLGDRPPPVEVLPVGPPVGGTLARFPTAATRAAVRSAGLGCTG
jgi:LCP family protein required for cell wall assembly